MRIATFNLESLDWPPKAKVPLEERIRILRPQLLRLNADILCLQEINGQARQKHGGRQLLALDELLSQTPYEDFQRSFTSRPGQDSCFDVHNLVVLSRFGFAAESQVQHELVAPPLFGSTGLSASSGLSGGEENPLRFDRPVLLVGVDLPDGSRLHLINLHLRAPLSVPIPGEKLGPFVWKHTQSWAQGYYMAAVLRTGQALEVRLLVDRLFDEDPEALIVVCGDFNAEAFEIPLRLLQAGEEDTGNGRLAHRSLVMPERSFPEEQRFTVLHHGRPQMLDHILISHQMMSRFQRLEVHNETLEDELVAYSRVDRSPASSHAPIVAEFDDRRLAVA